MGIDYYDDNSDVHDFVADRLRTMRQTVAAVNIGYP